MYPSLHKKKLESHLEEKKKTMGTITLIVPKKNYEAVSISLTFSFSLEFLRSPPWESAVPPAAPRGWVRRRYGSGESAGGWTAHPTVESSSGKGSPRGDLGMVKYVVCHID